MIPFLRKHADSITNVLVGLDRLVFRGTLRQLAYTKGMETYLAVSRVLLKDFGKHAEEVTKRVKAASLEVVESRGRPVQYIRSAQTRKEDVVREIAKRDGITEGLICALTAVEPCQSYEIYRDKKAKLLRLQPRRRKCLHIYQYGIHPVFGFMNARIQTWFPFNVQVCINGREWLARDLVKAGVAYERSDNCFTWIESVEKAQQLMDQQLRTDWPHLLDGLARSLNPVHDDLFSRFQQEYYWSAYQSEVATDLMFRDSDSLEALYPSLVLHGITAFKSPDVLRFLGHDRRVRIDGEIRKNFSGEITSSYKQRPEGIRVRHWVNGNSVKIYDKAGSVLRVETTINNPRDFKVYRPKEGDESGEKSWQRMRKGIADLARRVEVSRASNDRYLNALSVVDETSELGKLIEPITRRVAAGGRRFRGLRPWSQDDAELLEAINRGEFVINGFRNRDIRRQLYPSKAKKTEERRRASALSRKLRLLRAHGLIAKVPKTHRYLLTNKGRKIVTALLAARVADVSSLTKAA